MRSIRAHPLATYLILAFALSWSVVLAVVWVHGLHFARKADAAVLFVPQLLGPPVAAFVISWLVEGRAGPRALWGRLRTWRAAPRWYAIAILTILAVTGLVSALTATASHAYAPQLLWFGVVFGLAAGCFEEIGWTGYATPHLLAAWRPLVGGLYLGAIWGLWHLLAGLAGGQSLAAFAVFVATVTAYRALIVCVYDRARSVPVAQLMHGSLVASLMLLEPPTATTPSLVWNALVAAVLWTIVGALALHSRTRSDIRRARPVPSAEACAASPPTWPFGRPHRGCNGQPAG